LSLSLPRLPTDRLIRAGSVSSSAPPDAPLAVVAKIRNALRVVAVECRAAERGIRLGETLADARGKHPDLIVAEEDAAADRALLEKIADWCDRYTPLVALDPPHGLFLDITGCAHLFGAGAGGEAALLADCLARLNAQGFEAFGAVASTASVAWALAHHGAGGCVPPGAEAEAIATLPVSALRIMDEQTELLDRLGLKRIGDILEKPRAPLAARFGTDFVRRLDQALGHADEVLSPRRPAPRLSAERGFAEPLTEETALLETLRSLAATLASALERHGLGAQRLEASFFRIDGHVARASLGTASPVRAADTVAALFSERLAALASDWDAGFGFDMIRLAVLDAAPLTAKQMDFSGDGADEQGVAALIDRLGARLGPARVTRFVTADTHIPERAVRSEPLAEQGASSRQGRGTGEIDGEDILLADGETPPARPLHLFPRPEPVQVVAVVPDGPPLHFRWRRVMHAVARAEGPERIAPEWWRADDADLLTRDYYRVEDSSGRRYWIFRDGLYGREMEHPGWYVHGMFA
jgi:protein ImuB